MIKFQIALKWFVIHITIKKSIKRLKWDYIVHTNAFPTRWQVYRAEKKTPHCTKSKANFESYSSWMNSTMLVIHNYVCGNYITLLYIAPQALSILITFVQSYGEFHSWHPLQTFTNVFIKLAKVSAAIILCSSQNWQPAAIPTALQREKAWLSQTRRLFFTIAEKFCPLKS